MYVLLFRVFDMWRWNGIFRRYRLEDPRGLRTSKSPYCSPRGSLSMEIAQRLLRKTELRERSYSDDTQSDSGSPELGFLHPDHAWHANSGRGSSQSEQLEVEPYELNRDYSRSLPGSRRSSFQSQGGTDSKRKCTFIDFFPRLFAPFTNSLAIRAMNFSLLLCLLETNTD